MSKYGQWHHAPDAPSTLAGTAAWEWRNGVGFMDMKIVNVPAKYSRDPHHCGGIYWWPIERPITPPAMKHD